MYLLTMISKLLTNIQPHATATASMTLMKPLCCEAAASRCSEDELRRVAFLEISCCCSSSEVSDLSEVTPIVVALCNHCLYYFMVPVLLSCSLGKARRQYKRISKSVLIKSVCCAASLDVCRQISPFHTDGAAEREFGPSCLMPSAPLF